MTRKRWIILASALAACTVLAVLAIVIIGSGDDSSTGPGAPPAGFGQASQELQDCLAEQGIDPGSPPSGADPGSAPPAGGPDQDMQRAFEACEQYLPEAPDGGFPAPPGGRFAPSG